MKVEIGIKAGPFRQSLMKLNHRITQQDGLVELIAAMSVKLSKEPVGSRGNLNVGSQPQIEPL
jgi:hypothetical protein